MNALLSSGVSTSFEPILSLAIAILFGLLLTRLMKIMKLPNVTGYLLAGLIVGPHLFNFVGAENGEAFNIFGLTPGHSVFGTQSFVNGSLISTIALGFIAFSIGSSFELKHMRSLGKSVTVITIFQALLTALLVDVALIIVYLVNPELCPLPVAIVLGAIATATAPAATLLVVKQYKAKGIVTDTLLPVVALDDAIGLMVFAISFAIAQVMLGGGALTFETAVLAPILEIIESIALGAGLGLLVCGGLKFFKSRANRIGVEIASVFAGVALSDMWELSSLLVCMMIGAVYCNLHKDDEKLNRFSERWTAPLFMLFFVVSGAELNLSVVPKVGVIGIVYIIVRSIGKYFGAFLGAKTVKADKNVQNYLGLTLLPQAGVAIGMATMVVAELSGTPYAHLGTQLNTVILCATLIYELFGPLITKWALTKAGEIHPNTVQEVVHDHQYVMHLDAVSKRNENQSQTANEPCENAKE